MTPDVTGQTISPIGTTDFSFGTVVNSVEHGNDFTIDVSTLQVEAGQTLSLTLYDSNGPSAFVYSGPVAASSTVTEHADVSEQNSAVFNKPANAEWTSIDFASFGNPTGTAGNWQIGPCHHTSSVALATDRLITQQLNVIETMTAWPGGCGDGTNLRQTFGDFSGQCDPCVGTGKRYKVSATYTTSATTTITIPAVDVAQLTHGFTGWYVADVSDAQGNAAQSVVSESFTVDLTAPSISTPLAVNATNTSATITFSEAVFQTDGSTPLTATELGLTIASGTATLTSYTVSTTDDQTFTFALALAETSDGAEVLTLAGTVYDSETNSTAVSPNVIFNDLTPPSISTPLAVNATNTSATITFSEAVFGEDGSTRLTAAELVPTIASGTATLTSYTVSTTDDQTFTLALTLAGASDGAEVLTLAGTVYDSETNSTVVSPTVTFNDLTAPTFVSIAATDGTYAVGDAIDIAVTWDEAVIVTGTPTLALSNGATATYQSGTSTAALVFRYTAVEGDTDSNDLSVSSYSGTIADAAGNTAGAASGDLGAVSIDGNSPTMAITSTVIDGNTSTAETLTITFTANESTNNFVFSDITVTGGSIAQSDFTATNPSTYTVIFTPSADGSCTVIAAAGAFTDAAGNGNTGAQFQFNHYTPLTLSSFTTSHIVGTVIHNTPNYQLALEHLDNIDGLSVAPLLSDFMIGTLDALSNAVYMEYSLQAIIDDINAIGSATQPQVGDFYGGGVVYYIFEPGDIGYVAGETHGLIAAVGDQSAGVAWQANGVAGPDYFAETGATATAIGTGSTNTTTIIGFLEDLGELPYAAGIARAYNGGGFNDWFLPSKIELNKMRALRGTINTTAAANGGGDFSTDEYWSSTEISLNIAFSKIFFDGDPWEYSKGSGYHVRAARAF